MKVFNWMHRRFLNANSCTSFDEENEREKGGASSKVENEKHVLLEHDAHMVVEMLDHWKDGILSIGTLAINPLDEANIVMDDDDDDDDGNNNNNDDGDGNDNDDVMMNKYNNNYDIELADDDHHDDGDDGDGGEEAPLMNNVEFFSHELEKVIIGANHEISEEDDNEGEEIKKRVTLAELFMEEDFDSQCPLKVLKEFNKKDDNYYVIKDGINNINDNKKGIEMIMMKPNSLAKSGFSNAKKLLKKDLQPLKKFNKLMKRMMKKKIHPDMEAKMQKDMQVMPRCCLSNPINDHDNNASNNEFASLLLIQDGTV